MKKLWVVLFALLSAQAFGQAYSSTVLQNSAGNYGRPVPYPQVLVCASSDNAVPCVTRATTYTDDTLTGKCSTTGSSGQLIGNPTSGTNCNNPGIGDVNGNFTVYVAGGEYTICTYSGTWLCQKATIGNGGGSGSGGLINACTGSNCDAYFPTPNTPSIFGDVLATDDGSGNKAAKSYRFTDTLHSGFWNEDSGPALPTLQDSNSVYFSIKPNSTFTTYGLEPWDSKPTVGDCIDLAAGDATNWVKLHDAGIPCGGGGTAASTYRTCTLIYGADNGSGLVNLDIGPQGRQCILPYNATIIQVEVAADAGTPSVMLGVNHLGADTAILTTPLATAGSGGVACSTASGGLGFDGTTTCSATLQNTTAVQGDYIEAVSGTASTAHRISIFVTFTQPNFTSGGTVTSVGLQVNGGTSSGIFSVSGSPVLTAGNLNVATAGTSGGIPYFSSASVISSSAALTANLPVIGGGAGVAPSVGTVTGNTTKFVTSTGTLTSGHCVQIDASGNYIDSGAGCAGSAGALVQLQTVTASASATVDLASCMTGTTYHKFRIDFVDVLPATNTVNFQMLLSTNGGSTYDTGSNYTYYGQRISAAGTSAIWNNSAGTTAFALQDTAFTISNVTANGGYNGHIFISNPQNNATSALHYYGEASWYSGSPNPGIGYFGGHYLSTAAAVNAVRFQMSSGNIASGTITCYGITP